MSNLNNIQSKSILVVGDVMLDTYFNGVVTRISPEAPVPVFQKKGKGTCWAVRVTWRPIW